MSAGPPDPVGRRSARGHGIVRRQGRGEASAIIDIVQYGRLAAELGYARPPDRSFEELDDDEREWQAYLPL
jgi:hypothetical protein